MNDEDVKMNGGVAKLPSGEDAKGNTPKVASNVRGLTGMQHIVVERQRQINVEGWTAEHDDQYTKSELYLAGSCYADLPQKDAKRVYAFEPPAKWPFSMDWWKPSDDHFVNLKKAGALFLAGAQSWKRKGVDANYWICIRATELIAHRIDVHLYDGKCEILMGDSPESKKAQGMTLDEAMEYACKGGGATWSRCWNALAVLWREVRRLRQKVAEQDALLND